MAVERREEEWKRGDKERGGEGKGREGREGEERSPSPLKC